jgi:hypothetical protein
MEVGNTMSIHDSLNNHHYEDKKLHNYIAYISTLVTPEAFKMESKHLSCCRTPHASLQVDKWLAGVFGVQWHCEKLKWWGGGQESGADALKALTQQKLDSCTHTESTFVPNEHVNHLTGSRSSQFQNRNPGTTNALDLTNRVVENTCISRTIFEPKAAASKRSRIAAKTSYILISCNNQMVHIITWCCHYTRSMDQ